MFIANRPAAPRAISASTIPHALADHLSDVSQAGQPLAVRDLLPDLDARVGAFAADFVRAARGAVCLTAAFRRRMAGEAVGSVIRVEYRPRRDVPQQHQQPHPVRDHHG